MLLDEFKNNILKENLIRPRSTVLVAVSGGVDSVVLLDLLVRMQSDLEMRLAIAHLNHGIRGAEAEGDAEFVRQLTSGKGMDLYTERVNVPEFAKRARLSLETAARQLRYDFLKRIADQIKADCVALGHNADDQAETVLEHLLRGAGLTGLGGMQARRGIFIRPLLRFKRSEIVEYARQHNLMYREDSSNRDVRYLRNRLRHLLIPELEKQYNPKVVDALLRASESIQECEEFIEKSAREAFEQVSRVQNGKIILDISKILVYLKVIQKHILIHSLGALGISRYEVNYAQLDRLMDLLHEGVSGRACAASRAWRVIVSGNDLVLQREGGRQLCISLSPGEKYEDRDHSWTFHSSFSDAREMSALRGRSRRVEFVDAARIGGALRLRYWRKGDVFKPLGLQGRKKISDFFIDEKVPVYLRDGIPILECERGIIWICGYRISDDFKVTEKTNHILKCEFQRYESEDRQEAR